MRVLFDCDGVLCDFTSAALAVAKDNGVDKTRDDIVEWDVYGALGIPSMWDKFNLVAERPGFCYELPTVEGARETLDELRSLGHEIIVVTSPYKSKLWCHERYGWLEDRMGVAKSDVVLAHRKELVKGDMLVDDKFENVTSWASEWHRPSVLWHQPWNASRSSENPDVIRLHDWTGLLDLVKRVRR